MAGRRIGKAIATSTSVTEAVAKFAAGEPFANASDELYTRATRAFIDTIGVAIAGRQESPFTILAKTVPPTPGQATVLPTRVRTTAAQAAFLNGTAGHALDSATVRASNNLLQAGLSRGAEYRARWVLAP